MLHLLPIGLIVVINQTPGPEARSFASLSATVLLALPFGFAIATEQRSLTPNKHDRCRQSESQSSVLPGIGAPEMKKYLA